MSTSGWLFGGGTGSSSSGGGDNTGGEKGLPEQNTMWSSWTDAKKWEEFAAKTQKDAMKLAEVTQTEAVKLQAEAMRLSEVAGRVATEKAAELSRQAAEARTHYNPNDIGSSILQGLGVPSSAGPNGEPTRRRNVTVEDLDFVYVTQNVAAMPFPADCRKSKCPRGMNDILDVSSYLETHHKGHYLVLNISEESYDYSLFDNQVLEYHFPGHPAPPLGVLFKICVAIENWLDADERNIVVIHCLTGKGRTAALTSCVLAWMGEFASPMEALHYICTRKNITVEVLTIPSQRRYIQYFGNMLDGIRPRSEPILLRRVIMNTIPKFEKKVTRVVHQEKEKFLDIQGTSNRVEEIVEVGCAPYVQLFKCGNLIATATPQTANDSGSASLNLSWINSEEGTISFTVNAAIRGDILLRCRHADSSGNASKGQRVSMFRAAFHTGYVPSGVLRLTREQLDGAGTDSRFDDDFFIDLIFAPVVKATAVASSSASADGNDPSVTVASAPEVMTSSKTLSDEGMELLDTSEKYEQSLHKDARFWEGISNRKQKAKRRKQRKFTSDKLDHFIIDLSSTSAEENTADPASREEEPVSAPVGAKNLISDEDLINQLAYAELLLGGGASEEDVNRSSPTLVMSPPSGPTEDVGAGGNTDDVHSEHSVHSTSSSAKPSSVSASATPADNNANKELQALEELERELGLGDLNLMGPSGSAGGSTGAMEGMLDDLASVEGSDGVLVDKPTGETAEDVSLEELEQYLQTINESK